MTNTLLKKHVLYFLLAPCLILGACLSITGCGGEEEAPPVVEVPAAPAEGAVEESAELTPPEKPVGPAMAEVVPETLPVLRYMPAEAQVAVALPALPALRDKVLPLAKALADPADDLETALKHLIYDAADEVGVQADTYEALATALGVDPASPVAAFADFRKTVTSAAEAKAKYDASQAEKVAREAEEAAARAAEAGAAPEGSEPSPEEALDEPAPAPNYFDNADEPDWVVVLGVTDPEKARTEIERIAAADKNLSAFPGGTEDVDGVAITTRDIYGYFLTDTHIVFGHLALLRGAALRVKEPATFRYGTVECPPSVADEAVALVYGGRFVPLLETAMPLLGMEGGAEPFMTAQLAMYKAMFAEGGDDPMVVSLSMTEQRVELLSRVDSATHPGLMALTGPPTPLRLARYLPENTLAMYSMRLNDEFKSQLTKDILPAVSASGDPDMAGAMGMTTQVINQIGDELTIGITSGGADLPAVYAMVGLSQPEATQGLLQMFVPMQGGQDYEGFAISTLPAMPGLSVHLSFVDNILLAGNSEAGVKSVIDLHKAQKASNFFAALEPPLDIDKPVYQAFVFNTKIVQDGLAAAAVIPGGVPQQDPGLARFTGAIREIRAMKDMNENWLTGRMTIYLNDLEVAATAAAAAAESATAVTVEGAASAPTEAPALQ